MISKYDKAAAGAFGTAAAALAGHFLNLDPALTMSLATVITAALVWLVPNKSRAAS